ncbi:hypothetical protein BWQ96_04456 [Gracilariopsis chorda]|uniref:Uncharacterized protein n=1 Tax=Gracilariopsis chorda TaxID=448386 RepID=A0A2V3IUN1_9FLOR|nr:hypothetical protein BWQ96_04456 [Gracilariopsis chorda]|eukprot:PXF45789.1 hypothetical protein BWQ96_04456 [Gracilariopsis chorda]
MGYSGKEQTDRMTNMDQWVEAKAYRSAVEIVSLDRGSKPRSRPTIVILRRFQAIEVSPTYFQDTQVPSLRSSPATSYPMVNTVDPDSVLWG